MKETNALEELIQEEISPLEMALFKAHFRRAIPILTLLLILVLYLLLKGVG